MKKTLRPKSKRSFKKYSQTLIVVALVLVFGLAYVIKQSSSLFFTKPAINKITEVDTNAAGMTDAKAKAATKLNDAADKAEKAKTQKAKEETTAALLVAGSTYENVAFKKMTDYKAAESAAISSLKTTGDLDENGNLTDKAKQDLITNSPSANNSNGPVHTEGSCPGGASNIGGGQWAQTGGGVAGTSTRYCVQCGGPRKDGKAGPGVWGDKVEICGQGAASNYITRPDEVIDCKDKPDASCAKASCWSGGTWYADSPSAVGSNKYCHNGVWVDDYKAAKEKECAQRNNHTVYNEHLNSCVVPKACVPGEILDKANNVCVKSNNPNIPAKTCGAGFTPTATGCKTNLSQDRLDEMAKKCTATSGYKYDIATGLCLSPGQKLTPFKTALEACKEMLKKNNTAGSKSWLECGDKGEQIYKFCSSGFKANGENSCNLEPVSFGGTGSSNSPTMVVPENCASTGSKQCSIVCGGIGSYKCDSLGANCKCNNPGRTIPSPGYINAIDRNPATSDTTNGKLQDGGQIVTDPDKCPTGKGAIKDSRITGASYVCKNSDGTPYDPQQALADSLSSNQEQDNSASDSCLLNCGANSHCDRSGFLIWTWKCVPDDVPPANPVQHPGGYANGLSCGGRNDLCASGYCQKNSFVGVDWLSADRCADPDSLSAPSNNSSETSDNSADARTAQEIARTKSYDDYVECSSKTGGLCKADPNNPKKYVFITNDPSVNTETSPIDNTSEPYVPKVSFWNRSSNAGKVCTKYEDALGRIFATDSCESSCPDGVGYNFQPTLGKTVCGGRDIGYEIEICKAAEKVGQASWDQKKLKCVYN